MSLIRIEDIFDIDLFSHMVEQKMIRVNSHPEDEDLRIANYTPTCQIEGKWNEATVACRGLIYSEHSGVVIARPFPKFFNLENYQRNEIQRWMDEATTYEVADKHDGSLGIAYYFGPGHRISTRGSMNSEMALWATDWLNNSLDPFAGILKSWLWDCYLNNATAMFEIVYPENRIVRNYHGFNGLIPLGVIDMATGNDRDDLLESIQVKLSEVDFPFVIGPTYTGIDIWPEAMKEILIADCDPTEVALGNVEGWILKFKLADGSTKRAKLKTAEYKALHHTVTAWTMGDDDLEKKVFKAMSSGADFEEVFEYIPDQDLIGQIKMYRDLWNRRASDYRSGVNADWAWVINQFGMEGTWGEVNDTKTIRKAASSDPSARKLFATIVKSLGRPGPMFAKLDNKDIDWLAGAGEQYYG